LHWPELVVMVVVVVVVVEEEWPLWEVLVLAGGLRL